jgi:exodeoxyribonuclease VII large subunit
MATLARGYAIVRKQDSVIVRSIGDVSAGDKIRVQVTDGQFRADVMEE